MTAPHYKATMERFCNAIGHSLPDGLHRARRLSEAGLLPKTGRGHRPPPATETDCAIMLLGLVGSPVASQAPAAALSRGALVSSHYEAVRFDPGTGREKQTRLDRVPSGKGDTLLYRLSAYIAAGRDPELMVRIDSKVTSVRISQAAPYAVIRAVVDDEVAVQEIFLPDLEAGETVITGHDATNFGRMREGMALTPAIEFAPDVLFLFSEILDGKEAPAIDAVRRRPARAASADPMHLPN